MTRPTQAPDIAAVIARLHDEGALTGLHPIVGKTIEELLADTGDPDQVPGVLRYGRALDMEIRAHDEWVAAGSPATMKYPNGMTGIHPLMKSCQATAKHARDMAKAAGLRRDGTAWRRRLHGEVH